MPFSTYSSIEQRILSSYLAQMPSFMPDESASVSEAEQAEFYNMMTSLYSMTVDDPTLLVPTLHEDETPPVRFYGKASSYLTLQTNMRKAQKAMEDLLQAMFFLGQGNQVKLNKKQQVILAELGVTDTTKLPKGWLWMSRRPLAHLSTFSYCFFKDGYPYTSEIYSRLLGVEGFTKLEQWMLAQGYQPYDVYDVTGSDCKIILVYANPAWGEDRLNGSFEYKVKHSGVSMRYDPRTSVPQVLGLCIPKGMKPYLDAFSSASMPVQSFIIGHNKVCDSCRYCVQTDKKNTRPLAAITVSFDQAEYQLCPYFPGFRYNWTSIDIELADRLIDMLSFIDSFVPKV
ncbi:MAG: hypothetical protein LBU61_01425 [Coriobacteriales bacterium]|jgi:hypothetical protein|nr:hypothetical protein [Coriobacteriales bacterium]